MDVGLTEKEAQVDMQKVPVAIIAAALEVTIQQATILQLFFTHGVVERQMIEEFAPHASVVVLRLRERASRVGIKIQNRYGVGYMLPDESRDIIQERVEAFVRKMPRKPRPSAEIGLARLT